MRFTSSSVNVDASISCSPNFVLGAAFVGYMLSGRITIVGSKAKVNNAQVWLAVAHDNGRFRRGRQVGKRRVV